LGYAEAKRQCPLYFALLLALPIIVAAVPSNALTLFDAFYRVGSLMLGGGHVVLRLLQVSIFISLGPSEVNFVVEDFARVPHKLRFVLISSVSMLGQRRTVIIGAVLMAIGHFMMAFEPLYFLALFTLILGNGAFKPNISTQFGGLYQPGGPLPRSCLFCLLCRHQPRRVSGSARLRHAGRHIRLALWLRRSRRRNGRRACDLPLRHADSAAGRASQDKGRGA